MGARYRPRMAFLPVARAVVSGLLSRVAERLFYTAPRGWASAGSLGTEPEYPALDAMSTLARFPWVWVCVEAIASDLSALPLVAVRKQRGSTSASYNGPGRRELVDDPALRLLEQPNAGADGPTLLAQWIADELLTGNGYLWVPPERVAIYRLHPAQVRVQVGFGGVPVGYEVTDRATGQVRVLPPSEVIHIHGLSWRDDERACLGESVVRCLHDDLVADWGARKQAGILAKKGRPDILFSVEGGLGPKGADDIENRWEKAIRTFRGAFAWGGKITATPLSWSPKDLGEKERDETLRNKVLSAFGVPPTRAGLTTASYGGSRQEMRVYWERLIGRATRYQRALSRLARPGVALEFDFTSVEALQVSYTERLHRVQTWVAMGADPNEAAAYEQFDEAPTMERPEKLTPTQNIDRQPEEPQDGGRDGEPSRSAPSLGTALRDAMVQHFRNAELAYQAAEESGTDARLLVTFLARQLERGLTDAGLDAAAARWWSEEVAAISDELVRSGASPWGAERAERLATTILQPRAAEVTA